ncbi:MAG: lytic murein transglycosylase B [Gammaproteobacteria bacterium]
MRRYFLCILYLMAVSPWQAAPADILQQQEVRDFIAGMADRHGYDAAQLEQVFGQVELSDSIISAISKPAEALPWYKYRQIFLKPKRISQGVSFWRQNRPALERAAATYGVPVEIIVAIIGVETRYGRNKGSYKVIDALSTLAFNYPKRSRFFTSELEHYLLLTREQGINPHTLKGSYAGAMGIPQFISSSYRNYAIDFDADGSIDIWNNPTDAIGSVGNYFAEHGWQPGGTIIIAAAAAERDITPLISDGLKPDTPLAEFVANGVRPLRQAPGDAMVKLLQYENKTDYEYWLALKNFYVITRYNHSALYAMAVYQLANAIRQSYTAAAD